MSSSVSRRHFFFGSLLAGAVPEAGYGSVPSLRALGYKPFYDKLNVAAIGTDPLYYHWRHEGTNLPDQIYTILSIPSARVSDAGAYSVQISNAAGSVLSSTVYLSVVVPPNITSQPQNQSAKIGANVTMSRIANPGVLDSDRHA